MVSVYTLRFETTVYKCAILLTSMYVQAYLELSRREVSGVCCSFLGSCNWEPGGGVPGCRGGLRLVSVALVLLVSVMRLHRNGPTLPFHSLTCTMGFAPIKRTCTV